MGRVTDERVPKGEMRMKTLAIVMGALLINLLLACDDLAQVQDESGPAATPISPSTPEQPRVDEELSARPNTPRPAPTPAPASTPLSAMTPLAVLPSYTPQPTATSSPAPTSTPVSPEEVKAKAAENIQRCKHWALQNLEPIEFSKFERLNPKTMSDLDRILWGKMIGNPYKRYYNFETVGEETEWCLDYWSEPLSERNAHKRNEQFRDECRYLMVDKALTYENDIKDYADNARENYGVDVAPVVVNQYIRVMNWMDIDGKELLQMSETPLNLVRRLLENRAEDYYDKYGLGENFPSKDTSSEILEWWQIEEAFFYAVDDQYECGLYYPQLFFGRWIPIDDYGTENEVERYRESMEKLQAEDDWADGPDRDILIRLDVSPRDKEL